MAATYPGDVADAVTWSKAHPDAKGDDAVQQVAAQPWDPSVQSLVAFPQVLATLAQDPAWVQRLGDAFLAQPDDVMDAVQRLRRQAQAAGNLKSNEYQKVTRRSRRAAPAARRATPATVAPRSRRRRSRRSSSSRPIPKSSTCPATTRPRSTAPGRIRRIRRRTTRRRRATTPAARWSAGLAFGTGVAITDALWGDCDWGGGDIDIDVNRYNNININRQIDGNQQHLAAQLAQPRRRAVPRPRQPRAATAGSWMAARAARRVPRRRPGARRRSRTRARSRWSSAASRSAGGEQPRRRSDRAQASRAAIFATTRRRADSMRGPATRCASAQAIAQTARASVAQDRHASRRGQGSAIVSRTRPMPRTTRAGRAASRRSRRAGRPAHHPGQHQARDQARSTHQQRRRCTRSGRKARRRSVSRPPQRMRRAGARATTRSPARSNPQQSRAQANRGQVQPRVGAASAAVRACGGGHQVQRPSRPPQRSAAAAHRR